MAYRFFIWDFDGTLFDTYAQITEDLLAALREMGADVARGEALARAKISIGAAARHFAGLYGLDAGRLLERYDAHAHEEERPLIAPYAGALEVCRAVTRLGGRNCLYTHRDAAAYDYLERFGFGGLFCGGVTKEDGFAPKPAPDAVAHLLRTFGAPPEEALMVGDRDIDLLSGRNAGIDGCLFDPDGFYDDFEARYRVRDMEQFARLFLRGA